MRGTSWRSSSRRWLHATDCRNATYIEPPGVYLGDLTVGGSAASVSPARNVCLPTLLGDRELARDPIANWGALSHATHHHTYDLPPTAIELHPGWNRSTHSSRRTPDDQANPEQLSRR